MIFERLFWLGMWGAKFSPHPFQSCDNLVKGHLKRTHLFKTTSKCCWKSVQLCCIMSHQLSWALITIGSSRKYLSNFFSFKEEFNFWINIWFHRLTQSTEIHFGKKFKRVLKFEICVLFFAKNNLLCFPNKTIKCSYFWKEMWERGAILSVKCKVCVNNTLSSSVWMCRDQNMTVDTKTKTRI